MGSAHDSADRINLGVLLAVALFSVASCFDTQGFNYTHAKVLRNKLMRGAGVLSTSEDEAAAATFLEVTAQGEIRQSQKDPDCNIFTFWKYPNNAPVFVQKNIESWKLHSHGKCALILLNNANIKQYIPDMPDDYLRMPYEQASSDIVRYAVIYHHGGIYMDTDFLVVKDMRPMLALLKDHDFISYTNEDQRCHDGFFSSNFVGGKKGSPLHLAIWEKQKQVLTSHCLPGVVHTNNGTCCYDDPNIECGVAWASLGEGVAHRVFQTMLEDVSQNIKYFCYEEPDNFTPCGLLHVIVDVPGFDDAMKYFAEEKHCSKPLDRMMYHLFSSQGFDKLYHGYHMFNESTFIGQLYRKSGVIPLLNLDGVAFHACAEEDEVCECKGHVILVEDLGNVSNSDYARILLDHNYVSKAVVDRVHCSSAEFGVGTETAVGQRVQCICLPA